ncbi:MAG: radical SAM protein [Ignavibacteriaceae bacterium]
MEKYQQDKSKGVLMDSFVKIRSGMQKSMEKLGNILEKSVIKENEKFESIVYGPVPSRRLGTSLGINNIKRKICTYDCVYCQAGETTCCSFEKDCCLSPHELYYIVKKRVGEIKKGNIHLDYISFVPNGEPTIDHNLGKEILLLKEFGYKVAVFTNSSLLWNDNVKENLLNADYVSVKVDTVNEELWEKINRPHCRLRFSKILEGITDFAKIYSGKLTTETMLLRDMNDNLTEVANTGKYLNTFKKSTAYFTIPIRPPSESWVCIPEKETLEKIASYVKMEIDNGEMLCCPEEGEFSIFEKTEQNLTAIMSVHPMREDEIEDVLLKKGLNRIVIDAMIEKGQIKVSEYEGKKFYSLPVQSE